ncbi:hypothetical protein CHS0354_036779 [Potamilus streckersoni]|uniref:TIR domain-containing protein n=1 Tax=Potamilus streckersoni TaxID=2493646 RepID=A0AAE0S5V9_9BIVA|nr:hypothetical protein CHS0354_036779 [Potamilus streckersoni]
MGLPGNLVLIGITGGMTFFLMKYLWSFLKVKRCDHPVQDQNQNVNAGNDQRQVHHAGHPHAAMIRGQMITRQDIESRYFTAIARWMNQLQPEHLQTFMRQAGLDNDSVADIHNIKDVLILMSSRDIIGPGNYNRILDWLQDGWFNDHTASDHIISLVQKLTQAVNELEDDININDPYAYDALIIHTENDRQAAIEFQNHLRHDIGVQDVRSVIYEEFHNGVMSEMRALETVFDRCRFIFVYVSQSFTEDDAMRYFEEMILTDSFYDDWKKFRIIPIWPTRERVRIIELNPLPGIKYWRFLEGEKDVNSIYVTCVRNLILKGRFNSLDPH